MALRDWIDKVLSPPAPPEAELEVFGQPKEPRVESGYTTYRKVRLGIFLVVRKTENGFSESFEVLVEQPNRSALDYLVLSRAEWLQLKEAVEEAMEGD